MINQHKILRVLRLIIALKTQPTKTRKQISDILEVEERTVFRYINLLGELGYKVLKDSQKRYYIEGGDLASITTFTQEEAEFLKGVLLVNKKKSPIIDSILQKIYLTSEIQIAAASMQHAKVSSIIEEIAHAISSEKQLLIRKYLSINSETVSNRTVEPIVLTEDYKYLIAFEVLSKKNKTYNIERIQGAETLATKFKHKEEHEKLTLDAFGFAPNKDGKTHFYELELTLKAKTLLIEEYPKTSKYIEKVNKKKFKITIETNNPLPLNRFIAGLKNEITIIHAPETLKPAFF